MVPRRAGPVPCPPCFGVRGAGVVRCLGARGFCWRSAGGARPRCGVGRGGFTCCGRAGALSGSLSTPWPPLLCGGCVGVRPFRWGPSLCGGAGGCGGLFVICIVVASIFVLYCFLCFV